MIYRFNDDKMKKQERENLQEFVDYLSNNEVANIGSQQIDLFLDWKYGKLEIPLPPFLYKNNGMVFIGYHGDTEVTEEWNNWIKSVDRLEI